MISEWLRPSPAGAVSAVFLLAHPDDEFCCLPLIGAEVAGGRTVFVAFLTDGGLQAAVREKETLRVLTGAGVRPENVCFAGREQGWRDGQLHAQLAAAHAWVAAYLAGRVGCARIYVPAYEGGHHDHDCCFGIVAALLREGNVGGAKCLQFPLYNGRGLPGPVFSCMTSIPENGEVFPFRLSAREGVHYWRFAAAYPSQWRTWVALGPASMWAYVIRRSVLVQRVDAARVLGPPHEGVPYFERRFSVPGAVVLEALRQLLSG